MHKINGIIALDLDGTLLDSDKNLSEGNRAALEKAVEAGYEIVPTTGRFYNGIPEPVRALPFIHYAITVNGSHVEDLRENKVIYKAEIPWQQASEIMTFLDTKPLIYDCFMENGGFIEEAKRNRVNEVVEDKHYRKSILELRRPVPDLKKFLAERRSDVQKVQFFVEYPELKTELMELLPKMFPGVVVSTAIPQNVEVNQLHANKGEALLALADYLGVPHGKTFAFGDGTNDMSMIKLAGTGIAMENAFPEVKEAADWITSSCDQDGVARGIERFCLK